MPTRTTVHWLKKRNDPLRRLSRAEIARRLQQLNNRRRLSDIEQRLKSRLEFYHRHQHEGA